MMMKNILTTTTTICLLLTSTTGHYYDKMCVDWTFASGASRYNGEYSYSNMVNDKPSYILTECLNNYDGDCEENMILSAGTDGKWYFNGQPANNGYIYDPFCTVATLNAPSDDCVCAPSDTCLEEGWWGGANRNDESIPKIDTKPEIKACGELIYVPRSVNVVRSFNNMQPMPAPMRTATPTAFKTKVCVDWPLGSGASRYSGDYSLTNNMVNGKPSYVLTTCRDNNNCIGIGMELSIGTDGQWYFNGQPTDGINMDPFCTVATTTPRDYCSSSWSGDDSHSQPIFKKEECGDFIYILPRLLRSFA